MQNTESFRLLVQRHRLRLANGEVSKVCASIVDLHFKLGLGQFLRNCYTSIETLRA